MHMRRYAHPSRSSQDQAYAGSNVSAHTREEIVASVHEPIGHLLSLQHCLTCSSQGVKERLVPSSKESSGSPDDTLPTATSILNWLLAPQSARLLYSANVMQVCGFI